MATEILVNIGSGNGLLPDGTNPLPKAMLTDHQWSQLLISGQFHKRCLNHRPLKLIETYTCKISFKFSRGQWVNTDKLRKLAVNRLCVCSSSLGTTPYNISRSSHYWSDIGTNNYLNLLRPSQNGRHFADDIFKCIFLDENVWIRIKISLKFITKGPINNIPALVQIMAWRRPGDKPLSEPMMASLQTHICVVRPQWVKCGQIFGWWWSFLVCNIRITV